MFPVSVKRQSVVAPDGGLARWPAYAADVLSTDRYVSCLMPCTIAVWEDDAGRVFVSKMNTGLMGKRFGGNIARVMGDHVAAEEHAMLQRVVAN